MLFSRRKRTRTSINGKVSLRSVLALDGALALKPLNVKALNVEGSECWTLNVEGSEQLVLNVMLEDSNIFDLNIRLER